VNRFIRRALIILGVLGPGFVTASAGNDVGGIFTYSQAGFQYGYATLWTLVPLTVSLIVVQEMAGRMGAVTGKGLAGLIRENYGVRWTLIAMASLFFINTGIAATEFAGIAAAGEIFHLSRYIVVPVSCLLAFLFVLRVNNKVVERVFVVLSLVYLSYIVSGVLAKPDWSQVVHGTLVPTSKKARVRAISSACAPISSWGPCSPSCSRAS
jgi:NRAMP (natural resistance-associated macrophage protein)-like metal ion transporter